MISKLRTMALAASSILMMGAVAQAADLYTPAPAPMPAYTGGWYFSGFGGANWLDNTGSTFCSEHNISGSCSSHYC